MEIRDYNGDGKWSRDAVSKRYREYCSDVGASGISDLIAREHVNRNVKWIYPILEDVISRIDRGDKAAIEIGIEFIEEDRKFVFGRILKANTARALRRADLSAQQIERIRKRIVGMLINGMVPREFHEYAKLLRKIGVGDFWPRIEREAPKNNRYVNRYYEYFRKYATS